MDYTKLITKDNIENKLVKIIAGTVIAGAALACQGCYETSQGNQRDHYYRDHQDELHIEKNSINDLKFKGGFLDLRSDKKKKAGKY